MRRLAEKSSPKPIEETDDEGNTVIEDKEVVEGGVLAWGQEGDPSLDELRAEDPMNFYEGRAPSVIDPFAGGGAIPFEAMRLGCDVTASDLNPVSWLILKCTLDYPQRFPVKKWPLPAFVRNGRISLKTFYPERSKKEEGIRSGIFPTRRNLL